MRILLVDDSVATRAMLSTMLADLGYTDLLEAADGIDAGALLQKEDIDLVIVDIDAPHLSGIDLARTLRDAGNTVPLIMLINQCKRSSAISALQAGANTYIVKPFDAATLADRIRQAMENATI